MANICVVGAGHVGLVTSTCFAELGNSVFCVDDDIHKVEGLRHEVFPFYEPDLEAMTLKNIKNGRLSITSSLEESVARTDIVFIAVGTPPKSNGEIDLTSFDNVIIRIASALNGYKLIVEKSTVPINTGDRVSDIIKANCPKEIEYDIASNPEFLREGSAVHDFMHPDRIVAGVSTKKAAMLLKELYEPIHSPLLVTDLKTAELIKLASNSYLALKISYINAVSNICERIGVDILTVAEGVGLDKLIGKDFLHAGIGYGGYCLSKDLTSFVRLAEEVGYDFELLKTVQKINNNQRQLVVTRTKDLLQSLKGKTAGILGLSYKPGTDDMRDAPSAFIINELQKQEMHIKAYDPQAMETAKNILHDVEYCPTPYEAAANSDILILVTEWSEFSSLDFKKIKQLMKKPVIIDGRNILNPETIKGCGLIYSGIGR
jgi:UDPglucose 6-dehydrogenase